MRLPPADVLLSWPPPNYNNPVTRGDALVVINYIFAAITVITVGLRLYTRTVIKRWFGIDDVFIILALVGGRLAVCITRYLIYHRSSPLASLPWSFLPTSDMDG